MTSVYTKNQSYNHINGGFNNIALTSLSLTTAGSLPIPFVLGSTPLSLKRYSTSTRYIAFLNMFWSGDQQFGLRVSENGTDIKKPTTYSSRSYATSQTNAYYDAPSDAVSMGFCTVITPTADISTLQFFLFSTSTLVTAETTYSPHGYQDANNGATSRWGNNNYIVFKIDPTESNSNFKQVVSTEITEGNSSSVSVGNYYDPSLSITLTPISGSSYIWLVVNVSVAGAVAASPTSLYIKLQNNGVDLLVGDAASNRKRVTAAAFNFGGYYKSTFAFSCMIPASSVSSKTFKVLIKGSDESGAETIYINRSVTDTDAATHVRTISEITAIEVLPS